jgi:hypothetical protein
LWRAHEGCPYETFPVIPNQRYAVNNEESISSS